MKAKKFMIFDVDGTLYDNTNLGFSKINRNLVSVGLNPLPTDVIRQHWGMKAADLFEKMCDLAGAAPEQKKMFLDNDEHFSRETNYELSPNLMGAIEMLKSFNIFTGILTSRTGQSLFSLAKQTGLDLKLFDYVQTITHFPYHKPNGRVFGPVFNWARSKALSPEDIVYFGDTIAYDYAATQNSDPPLNFVGVVSGINTHEEFLTTGLPACQITTFENLPGFIHDSIKNLVEA